LLENDETKKSISKEDRNQSTPRDNDSRNYSPRNQQMESGQDEIRDSRSKQDRMESAPRQENRTPVFQPRNEPRQYNAPSSPGRSQPSSPAPQNNSGGGRRK
jgi:hypothetical protein